MQKKMLPVKTDGTEKKICPACFFFLPVGEMKKYVKNFLHFREQMLYYKTNFCAWTFF